MKRRTENIRAQHHPMDLCNRMRNRTGPGTLLLGWVQKQNGQNCIIWIEQEIPGLCCLYKGAQLPELTAGGFRRTCSVGEYKYIMLVYMEQLCAISTDCPNCHGVKLLTPYSFMSQILLTVRKKYMNE